MVKVNNKEIRIMPMARSSVSIMNSKQVNASWELNFELGLGLLINNMIVVMIFVSATALS